MAFYQDITSVVVAELFCVAVFLLFLLRIIQALWISPSDNSKDETKKERKESQCRALLASEQVCSSCVIDMKENNDSEEVDFQSKITPTENGNLACPTKFDDEEENILLLKPIDSIEDITVTSKHSTKINISVHHCLKNLENYPEDDKGIGIIYNGNETDEGNEIFSTTTCADCKRITSRCTKTKMYRVDENKDGDQTPLTGTCGDGERTASACNEIRMYNSDENNKSEQTSATCTCGDWRVSLRCTNTRIYNGNKNNDGDKASSTCICRNSGVTKCNKTRMYNGDENNEDEGTSLICTCGNGERVISGCTVTSTHAKSEICTCKNFPRKNIRKSNIGDNDDEEIEERSTYFCGDNKLMASSTETGTYEKSNSSKFCKPVASVTNINFDIIDMKEKKSANTNILKNN